MANMFNNDGMVDWVVNKTPLLVPNFNDIQSQNGHPVTSNPFSTVAANKYPLVPTAEWADSVAKERDYENPYDYQAEAYNTGLYQNYDPTNQSTMNRSANSSILNPSSYQSEDGVSQEAAPSEEGQQASAEGPVDTGDRAANDMIATLKQLDDGTLNGAERMVQNFERVAQEYAQRTGRNMQGDLFMPNYDQKLETNYAPFLNARNY